MSATKSTEVDSTTLLCFYKEDLADECYGSFSGIKTGSCLAILVADATDTDSSKIFMMKNTNKTPMIIDKFKTFQDILDKVVTAPKKRNFDVIDALKDFELITHQGEMAFSKHLLHALLKLAFDYGKTADEMRTTNIYRYAAGISIEGYIYARKENEVIYYFSDHRFEAHIGIQERNSEDGESSELDFDQLLVDDEECNVQDIEMETIEIDSKGKKSRKAHHVWKYDTEEEYETDDEEEPLIINPPKVVNKEGEDTIGKVDDVKNPGPVIGGTEPLVPGKDDAPAKPGSKAGTGQPKLGDQEEDDDDEPSKKKRRQEILNTVPQTYAELTELVKIVEESLKYDGFDSKVIREEFRKGVKTPVEKSRKLYVCLATYANIGNNISNLSVNRVDLGVCEKVMKMVEVFGVKKTRVDKHTLTLPRIALSFLPEYLIYRKFIHEDPENKTESTLNPIYQDVQFIGCPTIKAMPGYDEYHIDFSALIYHKDKGVDKTDKGFLKNYKKWANVAISGYSKDGRTRERMASALSSEKLSMEEAYDYLSEGMSGTD